MKRFDMNDDCVLEPEELVRCDNDSAVRVRVEIEELRKEMTRVGARMAWFALAGHGEDSRVVIYPPEYAKLCQAVGQYMSDRI